MVFTYKINHYWLLSDYSTVIRSCSILALLYNYALALALALALIELIIF